MTETKLTEHEAKNIPLFCSQEDEEGRLQEVPATEEDSPRWIAPRRRACSSAERKAAQSHSPRIPATASHLQCPRPAPGLTQAAGVSESLPDESPKASRSASRQWDSSPSPAAAMWFLRGVSSSVPFAVQGVQYYSRIQPTRTPCPAYSLRKHIITPSMEIF